MSLALSVLKELEAKWLVEMSEYFAQIIVHGFLRSGISAALDGRNDNEDTEASSDDSESSSDEESSLDEDSESNT